MIFGKIRSRLRNRVTKRMLLAELMAMREELKTERTARAAFGDTVLRRLAQTENSLALHFDERLAGLEKNDVAVREELKTERTARAAFGDTVLRRLAQTENSLALHFDERLAGLEKNDMAILEAIDRETTRLREGLAALALPVPPAKEDDKELTEATIKKEWFGEDD